MTTYNHQWNAASQGASNGNVSTAAETSSRSSRHPSDASSSLPPPSFSISTDNVPYNPYSEVFESDGNHDARTSHQYQPHGQMQTSTVDAAHALPPGGLWSTGNSNDLPELNDQNLSFEGWYDPVNADTYSAAQAFLSNPASAFSMLDATTSQSDNQHHYQQQQQQTFRDSAPNISPSPFASPAMSSHHRTSSFSSELGSPMPPMLHSLSQMSAGDNQYMNNNDNGGTDWAGGLQGLGSMSLQDSSSSHFRQHPHQQHQQIGGYPPTFAEEASSTSSLQSQLSDHQNRLQGLQQGQQYHHHQQQQQQQTGPPDGSLEQLIAQVQQQQQQQQQSQAQQGSNLPSDFTDLPQLSLTDVGSDRDRIGSNQLTFEQILESLSGFTPRGNKNFNMSGLESAELGSGFMQHPNRSAPNVAGTGGSPWHLSNNSGGSGKTSSHSDALSSSLASQQTAHSSPEGALNQAAHAPQQQDFASAIPQQPPIALRKPTREDSFDKLKKFLKIDVDMAYAGPMVDSPTTAGMRKRSVSDAGVQQLNAFNFSPAEIQRLTELVKAEENQAAGRQYKDAAAPSDEVSARPSSISGGVGPMRSSAMHNVPRDQGAGAPYASSSSRSRRGSVASQQGSESGWAGSEGLRSPYFGATRGDQGRRPGLQRQASSHRRGIQSEDFSAITHDRDPTEFLRYITAPDGSLAPPAAGGPLSVVNEGYALDGTGRGAPSAAAFYAQLAQGGQFNPQGQQPHLQHQRHASFGSTPSEGVFDPSPYAQYGMTQQQQPSALQFSTGVPSSMAPSAFQGRSLSHGGLSYADLQSHQSSSSFPGGPPSNRSFSPSSSSGGALSPNNNSRSPARSTGAIGSYGQLKNTSGPSASTPALSSRRRRPSDLRNEAASGSANASPASSSSSISQTQSLSPSLLSSLPVQTVTTSATQIASASRRKTSAQFVCPVPGCHSHFTRQFNLRSHLRSHADERPFKCQSAGCDKSFARAHDAKRHFDTIHRNIKRNDRHAASKRRSVGSATSATSSSARDSSLSGAGRGMTEADVDADGDGVMTDSSEDDADGVDGVVDGFSTPATLGDFALGLSGTAGGGGKTMRSKGEIL